jgi:hypothetical protein
MQTPLTVRHQKEKNSDAPFFSASSLLLISYSHKTEAMRTPPIKQPTKSSKVEMEDKKPHRLSPLQI